MYIYKDKKSCQAEIDSAYENSLHNQLHAILFIINKTLFNISSFSFPKC